MLNFRAKFQSYVQMVEESLPGYLPAADTLCSSVAEAMAYSLLSGGKRIRAVLTMAFYNLYESDMRAVLPYAGAVEMIHAYSLIHDDLPCMDDDDMRRGKPACHIAFGEATALLAGDGLLNLAFETMSNPQNASVFDAGRVLRAIRCVSAASGTGGMIGGQIIDLEHEGKNIAPGVLEEMNRKKTGALIRASVRLGCILGGAPKEEQAAAVEYAGAVGLAFQIMDDILDCTADERQLGKPVGSDKANQKSTYVSLYGLSRSCEMVAELNEKAKSALVVIPRHTGFLAELANMLSNRNK